MLTFNDVIKKIRKIPLRTVIPKPKSKEQIFLGWGVSKGEQALIYSIPNRIDKDWPHVKRITMSQLKTAYEHLVQAGSFTRTWFKENMPECAKNGPCNFTTIGGVFVLIGIAKYEALNSGQYLLIQ